MGAATADAISRMSENRILLVDRYGVGNEYCSSNDVNRVFRFAYGGDQFYTEMAVESLRLWKELDKETSQELLIPAGLLMLEGDDEHANRFNESRFRMLTKLELDAHIYDGQDLTMHFPQFQARTASFDPH